MDRTLKIFLLASAFVITGCSDQNTNTAKVTNNVSQMKLSDNRELLRANPSSSELHYLMGMELLRSNTQADARSASAAFQIAIRDSPDNPKYFEGLSAANYQLGEYDQALLSYLMATKVLPTDKINFEKIAALSYRAGYFNVAFSAAREIKPQETRDFTELQLFLTEAFKGGKIKTANLAANKAVQSLQKNMDKTETNDIKKAVVIDVLTVVEYSSGSIREGTDLIKNLGVVVSGDLVDYQYSRDIGSGNGSSRTIDRTLKVSLFDTVNYGLDIFAEENSDVRTESSPSIQVKEGETSKFGSEQVIYYLDYDAETSQLKGSDELATLGFNLELTVNELDNDVANIEISLSNSSILAAKQDGGYVSADVLTTEKLSYEATLDVPMGRVVNVAQFKNTLDEKDDFGTTGLKNIPLIGKMFGVTASGNEISDAMILLTLREIDIDSKQKMYADILEIYQSSLGQQVLTAPGYIRYLPSEMPNF